MSPLRALALVSTSVQSLLDSLDRMPRIDRVIDSTESTVFFGGVQPEHSIIGASIRSRSDDECVNRAENPWACDLPDRARRICIGDLVVAWWGPAPRKDGAP